MAVYSGDGDDDDETERARKESDPNEDGIWRQGKWRMANVKWHFGRQNRHTHAKKASLFLSLSQRRGWNLAWLNHRLYDMKLFLVSSL